MIEFTIKTLDSNNHRFVLDEEMTVEELKTKVREKMGIDTHLQRLIFCGRVMQDEKKLKDYDLQGKVVHLVQRAPPDARHPGMSSSSGSNNGEATDRDDRHHNHDRSNRTDRNSGTEMGRMQQQINRLMALTGTQRDFLADQQQQAASLSPTTGRLEFIRRTIVDIKTSLAQLRAHVNDEENSGAPASSEAPVEPMDSESTPGATQQEPEPLLDENGDEVADPLTRAQNARRRSYRAIRALRARHSRPRDLAQLVEELDSLQEQFMPFRTNYIRLLRSANDPEPPQYTEEEREHNQVIVDMSSDIMHSFSHAYHAVSDLNFQVGQRNPRLTADAGPILPQHLPLQAHINLVQATGNRRPTQQQGNNDNSGTSPTNEARANPPNASENQEQNRSSSAPPAGRNTTQPTVNINIQPDPITYQVEIETRVPIAFPIDNALLTGLANAANVNNAQPTEQNQQNPSQNQGAQGQANRRQVFFDFENMFRGMNPAGTLGGVEVVMSMEEIMGGGAVGFIPNAPLPTAGTVAVHGSDGGVYLASVPPAAFGAPSAEFLQTLVTSVMRQGLVPGLEGIALQLPQALQNPAQGQGGNTANQGSAANRDQAANAGNTANSDSTTTGPNATATATVNTDNGANPIFADNSTQGANSDQSEAPTRDTPSSGQSQNQAGSQTGQTAAGSQNQRPQSNLHTRRAVAASRAQALSLTNFIYDRFLHCDSIHARRRLQRRREQQQQQVVAQERMRVDRAAAVNITMLRHRSNNMTQDFMDIIVELLNADPSPESWYNAIMVAVARNLHLPEPLQMVTGQPPLVPSEFPALRIHLRSFIQHLMNRAGTTGDSAFEGVAEYIMRENSNFLNTMRILTPMLPGVDFLASIRMFIRSRLPAVIACVMSDSPGESFAPRFYGVFFRLFTDICALITLCCRDGIMGLRVIFTAYIDEILADFDEATRDMLLVLSIDNLNGVVANMRVHLNNVRQFIRYRQRPSQERTATNNPPPPRQPSPMELSSSPPVRDEPMPEPTRDSIHDSMRDAVEHAVDEAVQEAVEEAMNEPMQTSSQSLPQAIHLEAERDETPFESGTPFQLDMSSLLPTPLLPSALNSGLSTIPLMSTLPNLSMPLTLHSTAPIHASTSTNSETDALPVSMSNSSRAVPRASKPNSKTDIATTPRTTTDPSSNLQLVSPMMIVQHWGEEWVPVFTRDQHGQHSQRDQPPEPYSDAYLSGMPSRKRRCVRQARPATTLDGFINESVREAADRPTTMDNSAIRTAFREHIRNVARTRASNSEDYDPLRYASAARFLNPSRSSKQPQPESSSDRKDT